MYGYESKFGNTALRYALYRDDLALSFLMGGLSFGEIMSVLAETPNRSSLWICASDCTELDSDGDEVILFTCGAEDFFIEGTKYIKRFSRAISEKQPPSYRRKKS